ncbi:MAG: hypothetical protein HXY51_05140 [Nitrospirae bacterium]|nr:hypothetical protein [Nitrospirota bacterium]
MLLKKVGWACGFLVLGLLIATQSFAEMPSGSMATDHLKLSMYYDQQALDLKAKAENWEFAADYYEKFPAEVSGKMNASEHIAHCKAIAADFRKAMKENKELADKHRALVRSGVGP